LIRYKLEEIITVKEDATLLNLGELYEGNKGTLPFNGKRVTSPCPLSRHQVDATRGQELTDNELRERRTHLSLIIYNQPTCRTTMAR
jgi:hypothetical protein